MASVKDLFSTCTGSGLVCGRCTGGTSQQLRGEELLEVEPLEVAPQELFLAVAARELSLAVTPQNCPWLWQLRNCP